MAEHFLCRSVYMAAHDLKYSTIRNHHAKGIGSIVCRDLTYIQRITFIQQVKELILEIIQFHNLSHFSTGMVFTRTISL